MGLSAYMIGVEWERERKGRERERKRIVEWMNNWQNEKENTCTLVVSHIYNTGTQY